MRKILVLSLLLISTTIIGAERVSIISLKPFTSDARVDQISASGKESTLQKSKKESGEFHGVHYYFYYEDASGRFAGSPGNTLASSEPYSSNWQIECKRYIEDHSDKCRMWIKSLSIFIKNNGVPIVSLGAGINSKLTKKAQISFSDGSSFDSQNSNYFSADDSIRILQKLGSCQSISTKILRKEDIGTATDQWQIYGFNEEHQLVTWALENMKKNH